jgi:hypothetical protein
MAKILQMKKRNLITFVFAVVVLCGKAQFPHISGTFTISLKKGMIEADLAITNVPYRYPCSILLNGGLNIRYFRNIGDSSNYSYDRYYAEEASEESFAYYFPAFRRTRWFVPQSLRISYVGAFPVISDTLKMSSSGDWKGNIAFNGDYIRATEQSVWYPIFYDTLNDVKYTSVTYDIKIVTDNAKSIFVNGSAPQQGPVAVFKSDIPTELLLFAGNYDYTQKDKTYFLNGGLNDKQQDVLSSWSNKIRQFYENKLQMPYGYPISYLSAEPVTKYNAWAFVTYPTIAVIGRGKYNLKEYFDPKTQELKDSSRLNTISHELGHYYFGTVFVANDNMRWFFDEGVTEYISLQATRSLLGKNNYSKRIAKYIDEINGADFTPLNALTEPDNIDNDYRYNYAPLLLTVLEKQVGEDKIWKWLNIVLKSKPAKCNYNFFRETLLQAGVSQVDFDSFEANYIASETSEQNVIKKVKP